MPVQTQLQQRRGTAASWTSANPTLAAGEIGFESDTNRFKIGNGSTAWASLSYWVQDPVTTKGDLYTFSTTDTRLPVGANGETIVADSSTSTGLRYQSAKAVNHIINGGQDFWQRGTSFSLASNSGIYTADRFMALQASGTAGTTISRQTTSDTTNLPDIQYCARVQRNSGSTATTVIYYFSSIESEETRQLQGKTVVLSFWARKGADYSDANSRVAVDLRQGTGTNQNLLSGFTSESNVVTATPTLTTTWQRFQITGTVNAATTQLGTRFYFTTVGTAGAADYFEITGIQLELGSIATTFQRSGGTLQGELAACQRYYWRATATASAYGGFATGFTTGTTDGRVYVTLPSTMRTNPSSVDYSTLQFSGPNFAGSGNATLALSESLNGPINVYVSGVTGLTASQPAFLRANNSTSAYLGFSAEL